MYKKAYIGKRIKDRKNEFEIHLWEEDNVHQIIHYKNKAYQECKPEDA